MLSDAWRTAEELIEELASVRALTAGGELQSSIITPKIRQITEIL